MRTSSIIVAYTTLVASSGALAFSLPSPESFDNSILNARAVLPNVVAMDSSSSMLVKRAEGPWDCSEDEEYVPYEDGEGEEDGDEGEGDDDDTDEDTPVFEPAQQQGQVKAVQQPSSSSSSSTPPPPPATPVPTPEAPQKQQEEHTPAPSKSNGKNNNNNNNSKSNPAKPAPMPSPITTPDNIADGTYTAEEGCARYYQVKAGDICLKLVEDNKDLGLTLDQLYCLNPAIDDLCYNLWIGTSYCVGYNGEEPLNTGVSSSSK